MPKAGTSSARSTAPREEGENCTSSTTGRGTDRERCKESASVIGGTGRRSVVKAATREPERAWILLEAVEDSRSGEREHCVYYLIFKNDCQRARFRKDVGRCGSNDLASSRNDSSRGAWCDAPSRANASFANAREA